MKHLFKILIAIVLILTISLSVVLCLSNIVLITCAAIIGDSAYISEQCPILLVLLGSIAIQAIGLDKLSR